MQLDSIQSTGYRDSVLNFDTLRARVQISAWVLWLTLLLIGAELILRIPSVQSFLPKPEPTLWHATLVQSKLDYLKAFETSQGVDVLFMGNSTAQAGFDPLVFDANRPISGTQGSFNASIEGLPLVGNHMFLQIYLRYVKPRRIIIGLSPQDLNSNSPWATDVTDRVKHSPLALAESRTGIRGHVLNFFLSNSMLFRYRFVLHQWLLKGGFPPALDVYFTDRGFHGSISVLTDVPVDQRGRFVNKAGVLNYSAEGEQIESLRKMLRLARIHQVPVALVNMPLADGYYGNFDQSSDYDHYLTAAKQVSAEFEVPLWNLEDLPENERFDDAEFGDFNHLNQTGAERLSIKLGELFTQWSVK